MAEVPTEQQPLEQFQKWTELAGRGQQMMIEFCAKEPEMAPARSDGHDGDLAKGDAGGDGRSADS